jgi:hypothetical protein
MIAGNPTAARTGRPPCSNFLHLAVLPFITLLFGTSVLSGEDTEEFFYQPVISASDRVNNKGVALTEANSVLIQERANSHKNGEAGETYFTTPERRAKIPAMLALGNFSQPMKEAVMKGKDPVLRITVTRNKSGKLAMNVGMRIRDQEGFDPSDFDSKAQEVAAGGSPQVVVEAKPGSPDRKEIMDAMRGPVSIHAGKEVIFTGEILLVNDWAKFRGSVTAKDGKPFPEKVADEMEMDFLAILKKTNGKWTLSYHGWSGDIGTSIEAREKLPDIPEALLPKIPH